MNRVNYILSILATVSFIGISQVQAGDISAVSCSSSQYFSNSCDACFQHDTNVYVGMGVTNFSDTFHNNYSTAVNLREQDNTNVFNIRSFAPGAITHSSSIVRYPFLNGEVLNDKNLSNGEAGQYQGKWIIRYTPNTSGKILVPEPGSYIKLQTLTSDIIAGGRSKPIFEYSYNLNYNVLNASNNGYISEGNTHKECILAYPAFCGDGVKDSQEICDPNDPSQTGWGPGGCTATCQPNNVVAPKCENLTYTRNNNVYNFSCKSDKTPATKYDLYVNGNSAATNQTGTFNAITLAPTDTVECRVDNEPANLVSNNCKYSNIGSELACTALTANPNAGVGIKTFTSVGVGVGMGGKHDLFKNNVIIATENASIISQNTQTFANITTVDKDAFRTYVENSRGNRATSDTCTFTASVGTPCVRGNITLPLSARITATTPGLCPAGQTVDNFTETLAGTVYNYSWACNGSAVGGQCAASFDTTLVNASCAGLTYARNNNDFTFNCTSSGATNNYTFFNGNGVQLAQNTTGIYAANITDPNNDDVFCRVGTETATVASCRVNNVFNSLACSALAVDIPTGSGSKIFTSTATVANGAVVTRHQLTRAADIVGDSGNQVNNPLTWTFSGIIAQENNQFRSRIFDSFGNSATADSCLRTITGTGAPACGTAARTFASTDTGYGAFQFCATGTPDPVNPAFPAAGSSVSWKCNGVAGNSVTCTASRSGGPSSGGSSCTSLTATPSSSTNGVLNTTLNCNVSGTSNLIIEVFNSLNTLISSGTNPTLSVSGLGNGNYRATCRVDNRSTVEVGCTKTLTVTNSSSGGSPPKCGDGIIDLGESCETHTLVTKTCKNPNGTTYDCSSLEKIPNPVGSNCRNNCTYCGDGILDPYASSGEECDVGEEWCSSQCTIDRTKPNAGVFEFYPNKQILIGDKMNLFDYTKDKEMFGIKNVSTVNAPVYIPESLCVSEIDTKNVLKSKNPNNYQMCSSEPIGLLKPNGTPRYFKIDKDQFVGDVSSLSTAEKHGDATILTKVKGVPNTSFLVGKLEVRVAKPTITTAGGGAGLINGDNISDVNQLATGMPFGPLNPTLNKNLILTSLGINFTNTLSSNVDKKVMGVEKDQAVYKENKSLESLSKPTLIGGGNDIDKLPTEKYNGLNNVFIHKGNVDLYTPTITQNATYIIEGDLKINKNITTQFNVLFVVRGDIEIAKGVDKINAILMAKTISSEPSTTQLTFNGALYGDIKYLLENRTYIKDRDKYVDVGTNVNFSSKVFTSPPPLLSKFLAEFVSGGKIAQ